MSGGNGRRDFEETDLADVWPCAGVGGDWGQRAEISVAQGSGSPEAGPSKDSEALALRKERPGLLAVLDAVGRLPSLTVVTGLDERGAPVLLPLRSRQAWNLLVTGPASFGKSDWLRALALSLPLTSPPERLQLFGVDLTGRQLGVLEALPNSAGSLATNIPGAHELLLGLSEEMDRRIRGGAGEPDLVLVIDDLGWADEPEGLAAAGLLGKLWVRGWQAGIHVLAAGIRDPFRGGGVGLRARAVGWPGWFELVGAGERALVRPCTLSARDLDLVVRCLRGRQGGQAGAEQ